MASTIHATTSRKVWFNKPWLIEKVDPKFMAYTPAANPVRGEDGDGEVMREVVAASSSSIEESSIPHAIVEELENEVVDDGLDLQAVVEDKTRNGLVDVMNAHEIQVSSRVAPPKVLLVVEYGGHTILKSALVSQLNGNPFLSMYFNNHDNYITAATSSSTCLLRLGSDSGIYFVPRSSTTRASIVKAVAK